MHNRLLEPVVAGFRSGLDVAAALDTPASVAARQSPPWPTAAPPSTPPQFAKKYYSML